MAEQRAVTLGTEETDLVGKWVLDGGRMIGDPVEERISQLVGHELQKIAISPVSGAWETLYRDALDGRYWELTYPHGEIHGGGPKRLTNLSAAAATAKYRLTNSN